MFTKEIQTEKEKGFGKINFFTLTRKYWKEQLLFYVLTTLSCIAGFIMDQNARQIFFHNKREIVFFNWCYSRAFSAQISKKRHIIISLLGSFLYFLIVFFHVWFAFHLEAKVRKYLKELIVQKMFKLDGGFQGKQRVSSLLNYSAKVFSKNVFYIPNQLYYVCTEVLLVIANHFLINKRSSDLNSIRQKIKTLFPLYLLFFLFVCVVSQLLLYYLELGHYNLIENETKNELFLIENSSLIVKKSESSRLLAMYDDSLRDIFRGSITKNLSETFSFVFPSYFLVKLFPFLCLYYVDDPTDSIAESISSLTNVFNNIRKVIERGRDFPLYYSSEKKINEFLSERERDDKQNGQIILDHISSIEFRGINFVYQSKEKAGKKVLNNFNISFKIGRINEMNFPNGFGKSTIINLVTGMLKVQEGEIVINETYNLTDVNLNWWRSNISYSEHRNLISHLDLSTGQKQLNDLSNALNNQDKQVFIFDEADSNLDYENRNEFLNKIKELSTRKLVILVSHHRN